MKFKYFFEAYSLQMHTRDSMSIACKSTYYELDGVQPGKAIYKDPKTVCGTPKKSHKGLLQVLYDTNLERYVVIDNASPEMEEASELIPVFENSKLLVEYTLDDIRARRFESAYKTVLKTQE